MTEKEKEEARRNKEYNDFRGPVDPPKKGSVREAESNIDKQYIDWWKNDRGNLAYNDDTRTTPVYGEWEDFGNSTHDPYEITNPIQGQGVLNEIRANDQGFWEKVGLGTAKMTTTAASTFLDNTVGFIWGSISAIGHGDLRRIYDNDFTNAMQDFNEWCEEKMPHYSSKYEAWGLDFWGNFIGKDILQNLGFQIGTGLSMIVPGLGETAMAKTGISLTKNLAKFTAKKTAKTMSTAFKDVITSTYAAIGESSIEALQNKRDFVKYQNQLNEDNFNQQNEMLDRQWASIVMTKYNGDERMAVRSQEYRDYVAMKNNLIAQKRNKDMFIQQEAEKVGDMTFMANMAIVGASNYITFGKAVAGGMGLFKRSSPTVTDIVDRETKEVIKKNVSKSTAKQVAKEGTMSVVDKNTGKKVLRNVMTQERGRTKSPLINTIKDAISEGLEEMNQSVASEWFSGAAEQDMINYDALTRNGMAYDEVLRNINQSWVNYGNMAKAFNKVYTDPQQWRQFFSGMIGVGFSPHFQKGADGKLHFKFNNIGEQNAEINAYNSTNKIIAENINNILNSEESQNYIRGLVRHSALDNAKRTAVALDSKMDYQDADFAQYVSDIAMLSDAGKLDLFRAQLESVKSMTDEELEDYCTKLATDVNGKKVGEFVDDNGNYIGTSDQARMDIRKKINGRVDQLLRDMETYQKAINEVDDKTGGVLTKENLATYAWEKANLQNKFNRAKSILGSDASARNLSSAKDKLGLMLKTNTDQLKSVKSSLDKEIQRVADANKKAESAGTAKIDKSELQKELEEDIETLTQNINVATEVSQLIADLEMMQMQSSDSVPMAELKKLFTKYADFRDSMPEVAKIYELNDEKTMSLESLMYSGQLNRFLGWATNSTIDDADMDSDYQDCAKLYRRGLDIEKSLDNMIKNPERYATERAEMEQKILERENADTIKAIEEEIKKAIDDGSMNFGNIEERTNEIIDNLRSAKNEKNVGRRLFRNAVNMLRDTPFDSLRKIALENVLNSKKYQYLRDFAKFVNYVNVRIAMSQADPDALMIAQKTFTEFIKDKKTVEECLEAKIKLDDIDVSELYKDNYTPETYANAQLVQNEVFKMFETIFKDFAMDYYSPKLNIDKYDSGNILPNSEAVKANEVRKQIDKVKSKLTKYVDDFSGDILSAEDQENIFKHIDSVIEEEFGESNYEDPTNLELDSAKLELKTFMHKYLLDNANKRLTNLYDNKANDSEELKRNKEIIAKAKAKINKTIDSIGKNLKDDNTFNTDFDKLSEQDDSIEVRDSKEGYYVEGGKVMRGYMAPCQVRLPGEESADIRYAIVFQANSNSRYWIYIIGNDGQRIGSLLVDKSEIDLNNLDFTNVEGVINLHDRLSLTDFATIKLLEKENQILNDQQYRLQNLREQASAEVLQENGTVDENGKVDVSQNLHNSTVTVNALMDDNITRSKSDIETIVESSRPASEQRLTIEYYAVYDYDNDQILRVQSPTNGKRIKIKEENGKTKEVKFSQSQYKKEGINGILKSIYGDNIEILQSSQEEWTGKKAEPKTEEKVETKPVAKKKEEIKLDDDGRIDSGIPGVVLSEKMKSKGVKPEGNISYEVKEKDGITTYSDIRVPVNQKRKNGKQAFIGLQTSSDIIDDNYIPEGVNDFGGIEYFNIREIKETNGKYSAEGEFVYKDGTTVKGTVVLKSNPFKSTPKQAETKQETPKPEQPAKPTETPKQKAKKQAKQKAKNTASELSKQLAKLEQMEKDLEEAVKKNPDYEDTLHSVRTFKNYVQLVRDNYEEMGRPEKIVIDANAIWSINNKLTENLKAIFGEDNVLVLSDEEIEKNLTGNEQFPKKAVRWNQGDSGSVLEVAHNVYCPNYSYEKELSGAIMYQANALMNLSSKYNSGEYEKGRVIKSFKPFGDYVYIWNTDDAETYQVTKSIPIDQNTYNEIIKELENYELDEYTASVISSIERAKDTETGNSSIIDALRQAGSEVSDKANRSNYGQDSSTSNTRGTDEYNNSIPGEEVESDNQFVNDAKQFLSNFGISINDFSSIDEQAEVFDKLHKVINAKSAEDISDGVGYAIAFMMQHDDTFKDLVFLSTNEGQKDKSIARHLKHEEQKYKRTGKDKKNKYIEEVGKEISKELRKLYNLEPIKSEDSFIQKIWELITKFFDKICNPELRTRIENASNFAKVAAEAVKNNSKELIVKDNIKPGTDIEGERVDIGRALKENPYEESIVSLMTDNNIGLAGGASIASVGSLYRPSENPLHDLDFNAYGKNKEEIEDILNNNFKVVKHTNTIANADYTTETYLVMDRDFTEEPSEVSGVLNIVDSNGEIIGTRVNSKLILKEGVQGKMLDFFVNDDKSVKHTEVEMNGKKYLFANVDYAMQFKIDVARPKDIFDYARFIKNDNVQFSKQNGEVFGYTADWKIVLNKDRIRLDTPVHEYTHLWDQAVQRINPEFWNQGKELMKQSAEWQKVINDKAYESIKDDEDKVASEVHSRLAGYIAAGKSVELYNHYKPNGKRNWFKRLIDWFMKFKDFTLKNIFNMSKADCKEITLEQFLNAPVADFFMQTDPRKIGQAEVVVQQESQPQSTEQATTEEQAETKPPFSDEDLSAVDEYDKQQAELEKRLLEAEDLANEAQEEIDKQSAPPDIEPIDDSSINTAPPDFDSKTVDFVEDKINNLNSQMPDNPAQNLSQPQYTNTMRNISRAGVNTQRRDTFKPALSEFDFDDANKSSLATLGDNYKYAWNLHRALGAWDYVRQGKLKVGDEIYIGYGQVGQYADSKKPIYNIVMFVKDSNGEYQYIGDLDTKQENNNPESSIKLKQDIESAKKRGDEIFETITVKAKTASGDFASGQEFKFSLVKTPDGRHLTTNVSKILKGELMKTENQYRSLNDVITPNGQKDFNLCFFTDDGIVSNLEIPEGRTVSFVNPKSARLGHVSLMVDMPTGNIQLVPLNIATFGEINKSGNKVAGRVLSILKDAFDLYQSDMSFMDKNTELLKKLADNGVIQRLKHTLHFDDFKLFFNDNGTISVSVNDRPTVAFAPKGIVEFLDTMTEEFNDLLVNINSSIINNKETLDEYVKSNVFTTSLSDTQYRNSFFTTVPVNSSGIKLDARRDIPDNTILTMNNIKQMIMKVAESNTHEFWVVETNNGDTTVLAKMNNFDMFDEDTVLKNFTPEQRFRMISYAMLRNGISDNKYDRIEEECYVNGSEYSVEMLVHKTIHGDEFWYDTTTWQKVDPSSIEYIEYTDSERITKSASEIVKTQQPVELSAEEDDLMSALENLPPQQKPVSEPKADIESHIAKIMTVDFCKPLFRCGIITDFYDCLFVRRNQPICKTVMEILGPENMDAIFEMFKYYNPNFLFDINELMVADRFDEDTEDLDEEFESSYELLSEEAIRKILENRKIQKDSPLDLVNQKNDECKFRI